MMLMDCAAPVSLPVDIDDEALMSSLRRLIANERQALADFIVHLAEFDRRRLYLRAGFSSLFVWLTGKLRLSNASAFRRSTAARLQLRMPAVAAYLREGRISLTKICLLKDVLVPESYLALLEKATDMTEKEVEELALVLDPNRAAPPPRDSIRALPPAPPANDQADLFAAPPVVPPTTSVPEPRPEAPAPLLHQVKMTVGSEFMTLLEEVRAAMSHSHPGATLETLLGECMKVALAEHRKRTEAETSRPRGAPAPRGAARASRRVPAQVRRAVWRRDGRRCTFVSADGVQCSETHRLEIHHDEMYVRGGPPTVENLRILCKRHNDLLARDELGDDFMDRFTRRGTA